METKQVTVFGGSGLIGGLLIKLLIDDDSFSKIIVVSRSPFRSKSSKVENLQIDFSNPEEIEHSIKNSSIVFSAIGTTQANVKGNKIAYRKIDFEILYSTFHMMRLIFLDQCVQVSRFDALNCVLLLHRHPIDAYLLC